MGISHYIRRLNLAFEGCWSFEIVEYQIMENEVLVMGRIKADGIEKTAFGGASIKKKNGGFVSVADDLKAASSDALKKAASLLGLGLDLYSRREPDVADGWSDESSSRRKTSMDEPKPRQPSVNQRFPEHIERVMNAAEKLRWSKGHLAKWSRDQFGVSFSELTPEQTETALSRMREIARSSRATGREPRPLRLDIDGPVVPGVSDASSSISRLQ